MNRHLFAFASYNAGPNRIARLRKETAAKGLDPNKWFNNVEVLVAEDVGRETVQYVSNIYKYYIAYKLTLERAQKREGAKAPATAAPLLDHVALAFEAGAHSLLEIRQGLCVRRVVLIGRRLRLLVGRIDLCFLLALCLAIARTARDHSDRGAGSRALVRIVVRRSLRPPRLRRRPRTAPRARAPVGCGGRRRRLLRHGSGRRIRRVVTRLLLGPVVALGLVLALHGGVLPFGRKYASSSWRPRASARVLQ